MISSDFLDSPKNLTLLESPNAASCERRLGEVYSEHFLKVSTVYLFSPFNMSKFFLPHEVIPFQEVFNFDPFKTCPKYTNTEVSSCEH